MSSNSSGARGSWLSRTSYRVHLALVVLSALWLIVATVWLYRAVTIEGHKISFFVAIYLFLTLVCSLAAFVCAFVDKRRAVHDRQRISERTLHGLSLAGGWPGTCLGNWLFRHKTQKVTYRAIFWTIALLHIAAISYAAYLTWWGTPEVPATPPTA